MPNFQDTFETRKRLFISAFSVYMTASLTERIKLLHQNLEKKLAPKFLIGLFIEILFALHMFCKFYKNSWQEFNFLKELSTAWKSVKIRNFFWSVFSCIRTEYKKTWTRKNSVFGHFSRSECCRLVGFFGNSVP